MYAAIYSENTEDATRNESSKDTDKTGDKINCVHNDSPAVGSSTYILLNQYLCIPNRQCSKNVMVK